MYLNWNAQFGVISDLWNPAKTYRQYGTTVGFMAVAKYMRLTPPEAILPQRWNGSSETLKAGRKKRRRQMRGGRPGGGRRRGGESQRDCDAGEYHCDYE